MLRARIHRKKQMSRSACFIRVSAVLMKFLRVYCDSLFRLTLIQFKIFTFLNENGAMLNHRETDEDERDLAPVFLESKQLYMSYIFYLRANITTF